VIIKLHEAFGAVMLTLKQDLANLFEDIKKVLKIISTQLKPKCHGSGRKRTTNTSFLGPV
jgi:hypothetical protein